MEVFSDQTIQAVYVIPRMVYTYFKKIEFTECTLTNKREK